MNEKREWKEYVPSALNFLAGITVLVVSIFVDTRIALKWNVAKIAGLLIVAEGMAIAVWATVHIRKAIMGEVKPVLEELVQDGPYA